MMRAKTRRLRLGIGAAIEQTRTIACSPGTRVRSQCSAFCRSHHIERALFAWQSPSLNAIARKDAASVSPRRHERETGSADTDSACKLRTAHRRRTQRDDPGRDGAGPAATKPRPRNRALQVSYLSVRKRQKGRAPVAHCAPAASCMGRRLLVGAG